MALAGGCNAGAEGASVTGAAPSAATGGGAGASAPGSAVAGGGMIFLPAGDLEGLRPSDKGQPASVWSQTKLKPATASPTYYQDHIYSLTGAGVLNCAEAATGNVRAWKFVSRIANKNSFQEKMKEMIAVAANPGPARGSTMRRKA